MKRTILIVTLIAVYTLTFGQSKRERFFPHALNKIEVDNACFFGMTNYLNYLTYEKIEFDSLNQLPARIQSKARMIINSTMTGFLSRVNFIGANVFDLDSWQKEDTVSKIEFNPAVPKYELHFQLCDTLLGIRSYCVSLDFDQYGQVINYSWPTDSYSLREKFIKPEKIKKKALEYAKRRKYRTKYFFSELTYDKTLNSLCWNVYSGKRQHIKRMDIQKNLKQLLLM